MYREFYAPHPSVHQELEDFFKGNTWKGPDVVTAERVQIQTPRAIHGFVGAVPIIITPETLPHLGHVSREAIELTNTSVRSRWAQLAGCDIGGPNGKVYFAIPDHEWAKMDLTKAFTTNISVNTNAARPVVIPKGSHIYRYCHISNKNLIHGAQLEQMVTSGQIAVGEGLGKDWIWARSQKTEELIGMYIKIDPKTQKWIPPHPSNESITVSDSGLTYRDEIDKLLVPVPRDNVTRLWIGQSPHLKIPSDIDSVIDSWTYQSLDGKSVDHYGHHINSRLIDGGSNWPIRVEIINPTGEATEMVLFYFYHSQPNPILRLDKSA